MAGLPSIPSNIAQFIRQAANGTGLPLNVVAAQNYTESGYGTNNGPSSAGASGPWQFEPSTWASNSSLPYSDAYNWADSTQAYIKLMKSLLAQYNGNVRDALAAYNAGPGNLQAGYGYADHILALANQSPNLSVSSSGITTDAAVTSTAGSGIFSIPSEITGFFGDATGFITKLAWILQPSSWLRIGAFMMAIVLLIGAIIIFTHADKHIPMPMPVIV